MRWGLQPQGSGRDQLQAPREFANFRHGIWAGPHFEVALIGAAVILRCKVAGMLAQEKDLVEIVAREMGAGIEEALSGWMADIEDVLDSRLGDAAKLSAIQSIVNVCKRDLSVSQR